MFIIRKKVIMALHVDKVFILSLLKNKEKVEKKFTSMFDSSMHKKLEFFYIGGCGPNTTNDGQYDSTLVSILKHNTIDEISKDIFKNHVSIYRKAKKEGLKRIMILEEDAFFTSMPVSQCNAVNKFLTTKSYDIFYLGYVNWPRIWSTFSSFHIVQPSSPLTCHAYIMNYTGIDKVLSLLENNTTITELHIDKFLSEEKSLSKFAVFPQIAFQEKPPSLFIKACDKLGISINFNVFCRWNENISLYLPFVLVFFILSTFFFKKKKNKLLLSL